MAFFFSFSRMENFQKIKTLGQGAIGKAILAENINTKEKCVIKKIPIAFLSPGNRELIKKEPDVLKTINHHY